MNAWDDGVRQAKIELARRAAIEKARDEAGPCPLCGMVPDIDLADVTTFNSEPQFIPIGVSCRNDCPQRWPERFIEVTKKLKRAELERTWSSIKVSAPNPEAVQKALDSYKNHRRQPWYRRWFR